MKKRVLSVLLVALMILSVFAPMATAATPTPSGLSLNAANTELTWTVDPGVVTYTLTISDGTTNVFSGPVTSPFNTTTYLAGGGTFTFALVATDATGIPSTPALLTRIVPAPVTTTINITGGATPSTLIAGTAAANNRTVTATVTSTITPTPGPITWSIVPGTAPAATGATIVGATSGNSVVVQPGTVVGNFILRATIAGATSSDPPIATADVPFTVSAGRTIIFNLNNGTWPATGLNQTAVDTLAAAIDGVQTNGVPRRLGHTFNGWWTTATDTATATGVRVDGTTSLATFPDTGNITLFARWTASPNTTAVPANSTVATIFPDANLAARVAASLGTTFNTTVNASTRVFASDLAQIETLNLTRNANQPIVDLRGIPTLTGVRTVTPANGLASQSITLPNVARTSPLNHTNVVRDRLGAFVAPATISNSGVLVENTNPLNNTIRWTNVPANVTSLTYTWNVQNVLIGNQNVTFSGTATLPFIAAMNFVDVSTNNWFYNAVNFVFTNGYMEGTSPTTFAPNRSLTRAEVAVILYRLAGEPSVTGQSPFTDVTAAWQLDAVIWAASNNIVNGIGNNLFAPGRFVTREEFSAMFHRFAVFSGENVSIPGTANLNRFPDHADVSNWAVDYMRWATHTGLIGGTSVGTLNPGGTTTRAQCAQIIQRYVTGETAPIAPTPPPTTPPATPGTVTLITGTHTVGQNIPAGRYVITAQGHGNFVIRNADNRLHVNEILNDMQGTSTQGISSFTTNIGVGYTIEIRGNLRAAVFTPATRALATTLTTGHWVVGTDIAAGTYYATPAAGSSGNFIVHHANGRLAYNAILNDRGTGSGVPRLRVNLQAGQTIRISSLTSVSFATP